MERQKGVEKRRPRQDPVSCKYCRSKKLKCNRQQPCANCLARGLSCELHVRQPPDRGQHEPAPASAAVLARLQRLEDLVAGMSGSSGSSEHQHPQESHTVTLPSPATSHQSHVVASPPRPPDLSEGEEAYTADSKRLENVGMRDRALFAGLSDGIKLRIGTIQHALAIASSSDGEQPDVVWLPPKDDALRLLDRYAKQSNALHNVVHIPSVRTLLDGLYKYLHQGRHAEPGHVALILIIFACGANPLTSANAENFLSVSTQEATQVSLMWTKGSLSVLAHSKRTTTGCIEDIQATLILIFFLYNLEGISTRGLGLLSGALAIARDLSLHKIDCPHEKGNLTRLRKDAAEIEMKRRTWWLLAASDWVIGFSGGPHEGTYFVQPKHMRVNLPRNINDEDLDREDVDFDLPRSEATPMSYPLQRIRMAELCRKAVDLMPLGVLDLGQIDYKDIVSLDGEFETFLEDLPSFFRFDEESRNQSREIDQRLPQIAKQRYVIGFTIHTRRCKLHQPFLIRGSLDNAYSYSRKTCLDSARTVIQLKRWMEAEGPALSAHSKLCFAIHHMFLATIVLVMDLCFNKTPEQQEQQEQRRGEVMDACGMLEDAKEQSAVANRFLESLMDIMRKYKIGTQKPASSSGAPNGVSFAPPADATHTSGRGSVGRPSDSVQNDSTWDAYLPEAINPESDFDQIWLDYVERGPYFDIPDWDHLFSDLDSHVA